MATNNRNSNKGLEEMAIEDEVDFSDFEETEIVERLFDEE